MAQFNLITWNIQWGRGCDGSVDLRRIADTARATADFDVLCLQEVARNYPDLPGSTGEDQFALLGGLLPGFAAAEGIAVDVLGAGGRRRPARRSSSAASAVANSVMSSRPIQTCC